MVSSALSVMSATAKLTVSLKRRLGNGDEIFIAPGVEVHCAENDLDTKQAEVTDRVTAWLEELTAKFPDPADEDETEESEESEDEDADEDGDEDGDDEDSLTEDDVNAMSLTELKKLVKEQELEDLDLKGMKVKEAREAVIEALFTEEGDEDEDADEDGDEDSDEDGDEDEEGGTYDEAELKAMKLEDLQEICKDWDIGDPKNIKKAKDLKSKKAAYIKHILEAQDEEDEE